MQRGNEVIDDEGRTGALKTIHYLDGDDIRRLKDEFRAIAGLSHRTVTIDGRETLWFEMTLSGSRSLPEYRLDLGQTPSADAQHPSLLDRGLQLGPVAVAVAVSVGVAVGLSVAVTVAVSVLPPRR